MGALCQRDRQWGTVREDYSEGGTAWDFFPFDQARSRAYRWGEDGIFGICDDHQRLCLAFAFWNGADPFLKERFFGLNNGEGNHGEDVKEYYYYLDNLPSHAYMKALYKYPHARFPYERLREENRRRSRSEQEFELVDTGIFAEDRYFDLVVEYAKAGPRDMLVRMTAHNRGSQTATLHALPTLWYRNRWTWNEHRRPALVDRSTSGLGAIEAHDRALGTYHFYAERADALLFTENDTNAQLLFGLPNETPYVKDGIDAYVVSGRQDAVNPARTGTKAAAHHVLELAPGASATIRLRLSCEGQATPFDAQFDAIFACRRDEADAFYEHRAPSGADAPLRDIQRQAFAGMLWSKQLYRYSVLEWLSGDEKMPPPPAHRWDGRNHDWTHLYNADVISMPDKWEYPWYAAWDLAFHCITLALIDPDFAKSQLELLMREWYMHPNGEIPAYEWALSDVNPPVQAFAALRVYQLDAIANGKPDNVFLERMFAKLTVNFTWWVNRKDRDGKNVFQGGFLGLDNIGVFDRSAPLPTGGYLDQSDGTSWMAVYSMNMLLIANTLFQETGDSIYVDMATKFVVHFLQIAQVMDEFNGDPSGLWDEADGFYYDVLRLADGTGLPIRIRSMVGLLPLVAVLVRDTAEALRDDGIIPRLQWMLGKRRDLMGYVERFRTKGPNGTHMIAVVGEGRLRRILTRLFDEHEFLSPYGIRALSKAHERHPFEMEAGGEEHIVRYEPAESSSGVFGGNSNWRGPVWFPVNILILWALSEHARYYGDAVKFEYPTGSGTLLTLDEIVTDIAKRLVSIFLPDADGRRPVFGGAAQFADPLWRDHLLFYEYFHGDNGAGIGASHQTGWTGLVANLIDVLYR